MHVHYSESLNLPNNLQSPAEGNASMIPQGGGGAGDGETALACGHCEDQDMHAWSAAKMIACALASMHGRTACSIMVVEAYMGIWAPQPFAERQRYGSHCLGSPQLLPGHESLMAAAVKMDAQP